MSLDISEFESRYRLLPVQIIQTASGAILRRGATQIRVCGSDAFGTVLRVAHAMSQAGGATVDDVCDAAPLEDRDAVRRLIDHFTARRLLVEVSDPDPSLSETSGNQEDSLDVFFWQAQLDADAKRTRLAQRRVLILGVNAVSGRLAPALRSLGYQHIEVLDHPDLRGAPSGDLPHSDYEEWLARDEAIDMIVATSDFGGLSRMREWNRSCIERDVTFLSIVLQDMVGYVGPLVVPRQTPCFECFWARQNSHIGAAGRSRESEFVALEGREVDARLEPAAGILGDIAALELFKFDVNLGGVPNPVGRIINVSLLEPRLSVRPLLKVPRCPVCGPLSSSSARSPRRDVFMPGHGDWAP